MDRKSSYYKPNNMMIESLIYKYDINRNKSFLIGDTWKDIVCGNKSGLSTIFVGNNYKSPPEYTKIKPKYIVHDIINATNIIREIDLND
jgi:phosphoglycolate phosphatase-like HAD superfamily hydrolase